MARTREDHEAPSVDPRAHPASNPRLDALLDELAGPLRAAEDALLASLADRGHARPRFPVVLVVGAPRSGTTLMAQWLRATGAFATPSNVMARFSAAPGLSARLQQVLFDPAFRYGEQLTEAVDREDEFRSALGKTRGPLSPNEYAFFWRRHLARTEIAPVGMEGIASVDWARVAGEIAAVEAAFQMPVATKGQFLQYDLPEVARHMPEAFFLHVVRQPIFNAEALLRARERFHGDVRRWYSTRPPGSDRLDAEPPDVQVAGQVVLDNRAISNGLAKVPPNRCATVRYEAFCADTTRFWLDLCGRFAAMGHVLPSSTPAPPHFEVANRMSLPDERVAVLQATIARFESEPVVP